MKAFFEYDTDPFDPAVEAEREARFQGVERPETTLSLFRRTHGAAPSATKR